MLSSAAAWCGDLSGRLHFGSAGAALGVISQTVRLPERTEANGKAKRSDKSKKAARSILSSDEVPHSIRAELWLGPVLHAGSRRHAPGCLSSNAIGVARVLRALPLPVFSWFGNLQHTKQGQRTGCALCPAVASPAGLRSVDEWMRREGSVVIKPIQIQYAD